LSRRREILRKAAAFLRPGGGPVSAFKLIAAEKANHPIGLLAKVLGVSKVGRSRVGASGAV
jgi:hypothetical protein